MDIIQEIQTEIPKSVDGITFDKGYTARVLIVGEDIRTEIVRHRGVAFVSSEIGIARYEPTTGEWFVKPRSFKEEVEAMAGLDFHQEYLTEATQDARSIFPPGFDHAAFALLKAQVREDRRKALEKKSI